MPDELYCYPGSNVLKNKMGYGTRNGFMRRSEN